jgi:predicted TPR repeat methyltransferase
MNDPQSPVNDTFSQLLSEVFSLHESGRLTEAEALYRQLLIEQPTIWQLHFNLGMLYFEQQRYLDALACYVDGLKIQGDSVDLLYNTAICQKKLGLVKDAIGSYTRALELDPSDIDCRYNLAGCHRAAGEELQAMRIYTELLAAEPEHLPALNNLAYLAHKHGSIDKAAMLFRRILELDPDHILADHMLAAINGEVRNSAPEEYIREVFDQFADHYEDSLTGNLHYRLPNILFDFYRQNLPDESNRTLLDLGCGTGLVGEQFDSICTSMTGVDLSVKMITAADRKAVYGTLIVSDILGFLRQEQSIRYDLVIAADVFPYIGELNEIFRAVGDRAGTTCSFLFSVEHLNPGNDCPRLQPSGRFAHSRSYVAETAAGGGWAITAEKIIDLRRERDDWVRGCVYLAQRA